MFCFKKGTWKQEKLDEFEVFFIRNWQVFLLHTPSKSKIQKVFLIENSASDVWKTKMSSRELGFIKQLSWRMKISNVWIKEDIFNMRLRKFKIKLNYSQPERTSLIHSSARLFARKNVSFSWGTRSSNETSFNFILKKE